MPAELPRESSGFFADRLAPMVEALVDADLNTPVEASDLPVHLRGAVITEKGKLMPNFQYIEPLSKTRMQASSKPFLTPESTGSSVLRLRGHLFDTGLINQILNLVEREGGNFSVLETHVRPNTGFDRKSTVLVQVPALRLPARAHLSSPSSGDSTGRPARTGAPSGQAAPAGFSHAGE